MDAIKRNELLASIGARLEDLKRITPEKVLCGARLRPDITDDNFELCVFWQNHLGLHQTRTGRIF